MRGRWGPVEKGTGLKKKKKKPEEGAMDPISSGGENKQLVSFKEVSASFK